MVEVYYRLAYYTCCVPYKFSRENTGKYRLTEWWPQRVSFKMFSMSFIKCKTLIMVKPMIYYISDYMLHTVTALCLYYCATNLGKMD